MWLFYTQSCRAKIRPTSLIESIWFLTLGSAVTAFLTSSGQYTEHLGEDASAWILARGPLLLEKDDPTHSLVYLPSWGQTPAWAGSESGLYNPLLRTNNKGQPWNPALKAQCDLEQVSRFFGARFFTFKTGLRIISLSLALWRPWIQPILNIFKTTQPMTVDN